MIFVIIIEFKMSRGAKMVDMVLKKQQKIRSSYENCNFTKEHNVILLNNKVSLIKVMFSSNSFNNVMVTFCNSFKNGL